MIFPHKKLLIFIVSLVFFYGCLGQRYYFQDPNWNRMSSFKGDILKLEKIKKNLKDSISKINAQVKERKEINSVDLYNYTQYKIYYKNEKQ